MLKVTRKDFCEHVGRTHSTVNLWIEQGWLKTIGSKGKGGVRIAISEASDERIAEIEAKWAEWRQLNGPVPGPSAEKRMARNVQAVRGAILQDLRAPGRNEIKSAVAQIVASEIEKYTQMSRQQKQKTAY